MLNELLIKNFAIIDDLNIRFDDGLTILSGETGAGKSIIVNAVNLLLGSRASAAMIRDGCDCAELSAHFDVPQGSAVSAIMEAHGHSPCDGLLVRRIIAKNNRHRIYINDTMATVQLLASVTAGLASISGQHASQSLLREETHLAILDRFGGLVPLVEQMRDAVAQMIPLTRALEDLNHKQVNQAQEMELLRYQAAEIADADIRPGEDDALENERQRLKHAEFLYQSAFSAIERLHGADGAVVEQLGEVRKNLEKAAALDHGLAPTVQRLADHLFGLEDVTEALRSYLEALDTETDRLESVEQRLDQINRMKRKYGGSLEALFARRDAIDAELSTIANIQDAIDRVQADLQAHYDRAARLARKLSSSRQQVAATFARAVETELDGLKMAGTRISVQLAHPPHDAKGSAWFSLDGHLLSASGIDQAAFMIAPNVGESLKPLSTIASGGELSRVVLALKAILAASDAVSTIIFDEVDAGIGGAVADVVGKKLSALADKHQLICITHLPQIARFGHHHFHIAKQIKDDRTVTTIRPMNREERIQEIARMLGGETITPTALEHARAMMA